MAYIFCSTDKLAGLSFNGGLMFAGFVPIAYDWHDFINAISVFQCGSEHFTVTESGIHILRVFIER